MVCKKVLLPAEPCQQMLGLHHFLVFVCHNSYPCKSNRLSEGHREVTYMNSCRFPTGTKVGKDPPDQAERARSTNNETNDQVHRRGGACLPFLCDAAPSVTRILQTRMPNTMTDLRTVTSPRNKPPLPLLQSLEQLQDCASTSRPVNLSVFPKTTSNDTSFHDVVSSTATGRQ